MRREFIVSYIKATIDPAIIKTSKVLLYPERWRYEDPNRIDSRGNKKEYHAKGGNLGTPDKYFFKTFEEAKAALIRSIEKQYKIEVAKLSRTKSRLERAEGLQDG